MTKRTMQDVIDTLRARVTAETNPKEAASLMAAVQYYERIVQLEERTKNNPRCTGLLFKF